MSVVEKFKDEQERGFIELVELLEDTMKKKLSELEKLSIKHIYDFSFEHGVRTGSSILSEAVQLQNTGKDDHES